MEYDRYQQNHTLFIVAMVCMVSSMVLFALTIYIAPALIWEIRYDIPLFIYNWQEILQSDHNYSQSVSNWLIIALFFLPACITGYIAYYSSNRIENAIYHIEPKAEDATAHERHSKEIEESMGLSGKIFVIIIAVIVLTFIVQWLFKITSPT